MAVPGQAAGDQGPLGVDGEQPVEVRPLRRHPVVRGAVQHRQQRRHLPQRLGRPDRRRGQPEPQVRRTTGGGCGVRRQLRRLDPPAQRLEQPPRQRDTVATARGGGLRLTVRADDRQLDLQRQRLVRRGLGRLPEQLWKHRPQHRREHRGGRVGAVAEVRVGHGGRPALAPAAADRRPRVGFRQQDGGAPLRIGLGEEDVRLTERGRDPVHRVRGPVQQARQIGGRASCGAGLTGGSGGGDRHEHPSEYRPAAPDRPPDFPRCVEPRRSVRTVSAFGNGHSDSLTCTM